MSVINLNDKSMFSQFGTTVKVGLESTIRTTNESMVGIVRATQAISGSLAKICAECTDQEITEQDWYNLDTNPWFGKEGKIVPSSMKEKEEQPKKEEKKKKEELPSKEDVLNEIKNMSKEEKELIKEALKELLK